MFKALAEFVMRGRFQAIGVVLIGSGASFVLNGIFGLLALMSQGALGLVTLRLGWQQGLIVTLWASLPAFATLWLGYVPEPLAFASVAGFFVGYLACCSLRYSVSWSTAILVAVCGAALASLLIVGVANTVADDIAAFFAELSQAANDENSEVVAQFIGVWTVPKAAGMIAYGIGISAILGLLVARWWQALLYNPGGFKQEFHALRLPVWISALSVVAVAYFYSLGDQFLFWSALFGLPLFFAGLGMAHWLIARFALGVPAAVALYAALVLVSPFSGLVLMALALQDSVVDVRKKLKIDQSHD